MDKKYRDMTKLRVRQHTMTRESPISKVRKWVEVNKGRSVTKQEILDAKELKGLSWGQIYGVLNKMRLRWEAFLEKSRRLYPDIDEKERHKKLVKKFIVDYHEAPIQHDPQTKKYSVLTWERKTVIDETNSINHAKALVRRETERNNLQESAESSFVLEAGHSALSRLTKTVTDNLAHHTCGALIGPSMGYCPTCGESLGRKQLNSTKQISAGD
jgi:hypothetical protein